MIFPPLAKPLALLVLISIVLVNACGTTGPTIGFKDQVAKEEQDFISYAKENGFTEQQARFLWRNFDLQTGAGFGRYVRGGK